MRNNNIKYIGTFTQDVPHGLGKYATFHLNITVVKKWYRMIYETEFKKGSAFGKMTMYKPG